MRVCMCSPEEWESERIEEGGDAREGEAEPSRPWSSVKACLYSVRKKCKHVTFH